MSKVKKTSNAKKGGLFVGNSHDDGGIPAIVVDTGQPVEVEGGEAIINKEATAKHWKELSRINQSAGNGVPIPPPSNFSPEVAAYKKGGVVSVSELKKGTAMEMEHEDTIKKYAKEGVPLKVVARDIATDHLKENPNYYKILTKLKLAKGGQIVCRSCSNDWIKKDDSYVCDSCGEDNTSFYETKKTPAPKPKNKVKKATSSKKKYNLGGFTAVSGLFDGSQVNEETGETPLEEAARLNQSGTFREKRMFLKSHPEILMLLKKGGKLNTAQNLKVAKVMHEFKNGELYSSSGDKVTERAQALAIALSEANNIDNYATGGKLTDSEKSDIYNEWKGLINMSSSELKEFYSSEDGKKAGLSASEAKELGIDNGRKSARWILKMQSVNHNEWTPEMWEWAKKQISFVKRMSGVKGDLYDDKGNKTDKYLALLIWGNNPEKYANGGLVDFSQKEIKKYAENILKDFDYEYIGYSDTNGHSMYFKVDDVKVRFSDHSVTNIDRVRNEVHFNLFDGQRIGTTYGDFVLNQKILQLKHELGDENIIYHKRQVVMPSGKILNGFAFSEKDNVEFANGGKTSDLLAPNGKPSKLTPEQYNLVRTPEFKAWFGDWENHPESASKVVDENGEPLVVYHGTNSKFTVFNLEKVGSNVDYGMWGSGFYFSPLKSFSKKYGSNIMNVFLNIKEPFVRNPNLTGSLSKFKPVYGKEESIQLRNDILKANYDGVIQYESGQKNILTQIVVFEPTQIKLADGTNATFNPENPDIRFEKGGKTTELLAPNGRTSKLTPKQYKLVRTPEFKAWFGDWENHPESASKVVDENGEPLVVYHGTGSEFFTFQKTTFGKLGQGMYFTSFFDDANYYAKRYEGGRVIPVFLDSKSLAIISNPFAKNELPDKYDGVWAFKGGQGGEEIVVYEPNQIKLADGTNTTFNPENPDIRFEKGGKVTDLIAPNGKPSKLTPKQYKLVRTPEFKAWFGDWEINPEASSKILDKNGEPLVVYHGTRAGNFNSKTGEFSKFTKFSTEDRIGVWFSPVKKIAKNMFMEEQKYVYDVFLDIKHPFLVDSIGEDSAVKYYQHMLEDGVTIWQAEESLKNELLNKGYDGIILEDTVRDVPYPAKVGVDQIIAFNPTQIKIADGTNTTFNPESPDIRFEKGGKVTDLIAPNGHVSNLSPELYKFVRTKKFKDWFGDWENHPENASKVVDVNGEPLVVYRAVTKIGEFPTPLSSEHFYTDNLQLARKYSKPRKRKIKHAFLKIMFVNEMNASGDVYSENPKLYNDFFRNSADGFDGSVLRHIIMPPTDEKSLVPSSSVYSVHNLAQVMSTSGEIDDESEDLSAATAKYDGFLFDGKQEKIYKEWNRLINMSVDEMADFMHTDKAHNLSKKELKELDIDMNLPKRIHKMKSKPANKWTIQDWRSAQAQIAFIKKMLISDDQLYNVDGKKTKQHHLLLVGGHNPVKYKAGGRLSKKHQGGDCYCIAGKFALNDVSEIGGHKFIGTPYVVHAEVEGRGALTGIRYGHAWIEDDLMIFDYSNAKKIIFPKELYYTMGKVILEQPKYYKYTFEEACQKMEETGHYGCWDLITESGL